MPVHATVSREPSWVKVPAFMGSVPAIALGYVAVVVLLRLHAGFFCGAVTTWPVPPDPNEALRPSPLDFHSVFVVLRVPLLVPTANVVLLLPVTLPGRIPALHRVNADVADRLSVVKHLLSEFLRLLIGRTVEDHPSQLLFCDMVKTVPPTRLLGLSVYPVSLLRFSRKLPDYGLDRSVLRARDSPCDLPDGIPPRSRYRLQPERIRPGRRVGATTILRRTGKAGSPATTTDPRWDTPSPGAARGRRRGDL